MLMQAQKTFLNDFPACFRIGAQEAGVPANRYMFLIVQVENHSPYRDIFQVLRLPGCSGQRKNVCSSHISNTNVSAACQVKQRKDLALPAEPTGRSLGSCTGGLGCALLWPAVSHAMCL